VESFKDWSVYRREEVRPQLFFAFSMPKEDDTGQRQARHCFVPDSSWPAQKKKEKTSPRIVAVPFQVMSKAVVEVGSDKFEFAKS